ncbi:hypothetical protein LZ554_004932 [Drepanopeziza brunnea f. sp. 'monogermtubi']|nr:hypothetical protein LZ554_004932 [Drepanopeziza brunnea f. sp. 'monogermtubi']
MADMERRTNAQFSLFRMSCDHCHSVSQSVEYHCSKCDLDFEDNALEWTRQKIVAPGSCEVCEWIEGIPAPATVKTLHNTTTKTYPTLFKPPRDSDRPQQLFENEHRHIRKSNPREILIYTDGACQNNGQNNP